MRHGWTLFFLSITALGCGDDEPSASGGAGPSSSSSGASAGGAGAAGGAGEGGSGAASGPGGTGPGGSGGQADVDPIAGIDPVALVGGGFEFTEGPCWFAAQAELLFTDIPPGRIHRLTPPDAITIAFEPSGNANGLGIDENDRLIACEHGNRQVTRRLSGGQIQVVASEWMGQSLNSPNDVIVRSDGTIYFTDPPYGIDPGQQELSFQGVFRVSPDTQIHLVDDTMDRPNGIALSPDEKTLYVTDSAVGLVRQYAVDTDGSTGPGAKLMDTSGGSDGMAVDDAGNLYVTTSAGVEVYRADGTLRGTIAVPEQPANCTFGAVDRRTLYITARTGLYSVVTNVPGKP
jgi:gluconolactonase